MPLRVESNFQRRLVADRRSGADLRKVDDRSAQGERRMGGDRRRGKPPVDRKAPILIVLLVAGFCAYDVEKQQGRHTLVPLTEAAAAADMLAARIAGAAFSR